MEMNAKSWVCFFKPGARVVALPNWKNPKLLLSVSSPPEMVSYISKYFDVYTLRSDLYKRWLQIRSLARNMKMETTPDGEWCLESLLEGTGLNEKVANVVVLIGRPTPIQKLKIILLNCHGEAIGYIKYGERGLAQKRIVHEYKILSNLPDNLGPKPLRMDKVLHGIGMLISVVTGKKTKILIPPPREVLEFQERLVVDTSKDLYEHPWIQELRKKGFQHWEWLAPLEGNKWNVVIQHNDFVPWNLIKTGDGRIVAIDWEFANLCGFPFLDLIYYFLQVGALIYRWKPESAFRHALRYLVQELHVQEDISKSLIKLAAFEAYWITAQNGRDDSFPLQQWRRTVWEVEG